MERIEVIDEPPEPEAPGVVGAMHYLLSPQWSRLGGVEVVNRCAPAGAFSPWAYVTRFAQARGHAPATPPVCPRASGPLGLLRSPDLNRHPSSLETLQFLEERARARGVEVRWLTRHDLAAVDELGALFIRDDTSTLNHTWQFSQRAAARGLPVIDTPDAIVAAADKALEAELFALHGVPAPPTLLVHAGNVDEVVDTLGLPFVLKRVDGSFGHEVWRIDDLETLARRLALALDDRLFAVAQPWLPTAFDWRIGLLGGQPLFAAIYHMAPGHWQTSRWEGDEYVASGRTEAVPLGDVPHAVLEVAVAAGRTVGDGLLGVDLKALDGSVLVVEVNDCADLDVGYEDVAEGPVVYERLLDALGYG